jgi:hypothetical protein
MRLGNLFRKGSPGRLSALVKKVATRFSGAAIIGTFVSMIGVFVAVAQTVSDDCLQTPHFFLNSLVGKRLYVNRF